MIFKGQSILFFIFLSLSSPSLWAAKHMMVIGGGGEPEGPNTRFDNDMITLAGNLNKANWDYNVAFNGGHRETENNLRLHYFKAKASITPFTEDSYEKNLNDYKEKILMGEIASGDQLMIMINSHGAMNSGKEKTHLISARGGSIKDYNNLSGSTVVSLDKLEELIALAEKRGIKLGIVDLSCHSGNIQALKKNAPNTCIISATGTDHYAYIGPNSFASRFIANLKPNTTLEKAFLKARTEAIDPEYPMISTDEGQEISSEIYQRISRFLHYYRIPDEDKVTAYILNNSDPSLQCLRESQFTQLFSHIDKLQNIMKEQKFNELKRLLYEYKTAQDQMIKAAAGMAGNDVLNRNFEYVYPDNSKAVMTWKEVLAENPDERIKGFQKALADTKNPTEKISHSIQLERFKTVKKKKEEILSNYPKIGDEYLDTIKKQIANTKLGNDLSRKIILEEKKLFDELYKQKQSLNFNDPCRQIVF